VNLENAKAGDMLIAGSLFSSQTRCLMVDRTTATQVICGNERFRKTDGKSVGTSGWHSYWARIPSAEELAKAQLAARIAIAADKLRRLRVTEENLAAVEALLVTPDGKKE
jgi:hypothetical protein